MTVSLRSRRARTLMSLSALPIAAAGLAACTTPGGGGGPVPGGGAGCTPVEVLSARGTTEPQSGSLIMGGLTRGIASALGGNTYEVRYSASAEYLISPQEGVTDSINRIKARSAQCPDQVYVLTGYSKGGIVMTQLMSQIPANLGAKVKAVVMYGNPMHKRNSPSSAGSGKNGGGIYPGGVPASWTARTRQYCNGGDPICGAGANFAAHLGYGVYQSDGINFAVSKVRGG